MDMSNISVKSLYEMLKVMLSPAGPLLVGWPSQKSHRFLSGAQPSPQHWAIRSRPDPRAKS